MFKHGINIYLDYLVLGGTLQSSSLSMIFFCPIFKSSMVQCLFSFIFTVRTGVGVYVLNTENFGYIMKPSDHTHSSLQDQADNFINFKLKTLGKT